MNRNIILGLIVLAVVIVIAWLVLNTGPRYNPTSPTATPTPGLSS